ncbi:MAG: carbohydrate binding domain-containing protein [Armatimonadota bacterium]
MVRPTAALMTALAMTAALAQDEPVELPLANPSFEEDGSWSMVPPAPIAYDAGVARTGQRSLRISDPDGQSAAYAAQGVQGLVGGATYSFTAWYRASAEDKGAGWSPALKVEYYNDAGQNTYGEYMRTSEATDGEWRQLVLTTEAPPDTTRVSVLVRLFGAGSVWFDDVALTQVTAPPVVSLAPLRQIVKPGQRTVTLTARVAEPFDNTEPPIRIMVYEGEGEEIGAEVALERGEGRVWTATLTLPELAPGTYRVESSLGPIPGQMARLFVPLSDRQPTNLTNTGTILVNGEPFFPIGLYHVSVAQYPMLAEAGFNAVQGVGPQDLEAFGRALDACAENGLMMDVPLYTGMKVRENMADSLAGIEAYADHPAVLCWKIIDEPDLRPEMPEQVAEAYATLKAADPAHPIELTLCQPPGFGFWANFCDIMQVDPYPLPRYPLTMVSDWVDTAMAGLEPWQNLTAVLQSGWTHTPFNQPTPEQARCMVYLALIHGAKGIFWYSFRDPGWQLEETPLWEHFPAINAETLELSRPVMLGEAAPEITVTSPDDVVHWRAWRHEGKACLLLANPGEAPITATVNPGGPCTVCELHGEGLENIDGTFEVELLAFGAQTRVITGR